MTFNIGINVIETEGTATPTIAGAATSTAGFLVQTRRGPAHTPTFVTSFAQFQDRFGGFETASMGAHLVFGFFQNGGRRAWITRVTSTDGDGATPADATVRQTAAGNSRALLDVTAGFRGSEDPGAWANGLHVYIEPTFSAGAATPLDISADTLGLQTVSGFAAGDRVVVSNGNNRHATTVTAVDAAARRLTIAPPLPQVGDFADAGTRVSSTTVDLFVTETRIDDDVDVPELERLTGLSFDPASEQYAPTIINNPATGSTHLRAEDARSQNLTADDAPHARVFRELGGGTSPVVAATDYVGDAAARTGLRALDAVDIQLLTSDTVDPIVVRNGLDYAFGRGDCLYVGSVPRDAVGGGTAVDYGAGFQGSKVYGALYGPWILVTNPISRTDPVLWVPPAGHVMGVMARVEQTRGIHKAPAGDEARVFGALDVEHHLSDADHTDMVERGTVNAIRSVPGAGIVVDSSRTLSTDIRWRYVNVRLLFNYVKSSLKQGLRWVRQEPNRDTLWTAVTFGSVRPFLLGLWREGAFGTGEPDEVFTIVCDASNNPPAMVDQGILTVEVTFYPSKPAEKIVIRVGQQPSRATATEA